VNRVHFARSYPATNMLPEEVQACLMLCVINLNYVLYNDNYKIYQFYIGMILLLFNRNSNYQYLFIFDKDMMM